MRCRKWLHDIAADYSASVGLIDAQETIAASARKAEDLVQLMPWHARFAVECVEIAASIFCLLDQLFHGGKTDPARVMRNFAKVPLISSPLLRLYRSVIAVTFFEQDAVLSALGVEKPEIRQDRFRQIRNKDQAA